MLKWCSKITIVAVDQPESGREKARSGAQGYPDHPRHESRKMDVCGIIGSQDVGNASKVYFM
jgi:hypothetical protein